MASIWNQWSITVNCATPPWSATCAVSVSRSTSRCSQSGWVKFA